MTHSITKLTRPVRRRLQKIAQFNRDGNYQDMITVLDQPKKAKAKKVALATSRQD